MPTLNQLVKRKRIIVNHEDHFAFYYRHFITPLGKLKMIWSITGILLGNALRALANPSKEGFSYLKNNFDGIAIAYKNREKIKKSKFRTFLNPDMSLKKEYA